MTCVRCDSWENERLRRSGQSCEYKPPSPVLCSGRSSDKCMIATDYSADGQCTNTMVITINAMENLFKKNFATEIFCL